MLGAPFSVPMPLPMAFTWPPSIAWDSSMATFWAIALPGPGLEFWGGSFLADPFGRVIAKAGHDAEEIVLGEVDRSLIEETRRNWPFLRDRRVDAYAPITQRFIDAASDAQPATKAANNNVRSSTSKDPARVGVPHAC